MNIKRVEKPPKKGVSIVFFSIALSALVFIMTQGMFSARAGAPAAKAPNIYSSTRDFQEFSLLGDAAVTLKVRKLSPQTLGGVHVYTSPVVSLAHQFNGVGINWFGTLPQSTSASFELRVAHGAHWTHWQSAPVSTDWKDGIPESAASASGAFSDVMFLGNATAAQYRVTFSTKNAHETPEITRVKLIFIDSTQGPTAAEAATQAEKVSAADASADPFRPHIISRAEWGADESLRFWQPEIQAPAKKIILHHTAGALGGDDPAAVVRGIYYYHTVTRGWGDIGYNFLIDEHGNIYEGRYGGDNVVGAHTYAYNENTIGVSTLGNYQYDIPTAESLQAVEQLSGYFAQKNGFAPNETSYIHSKLTENIAGHRDYNSTACPGENYYAMLPAIRGGAQAVYNQIRLGVPVPTVPDYQASLVSINWPNSIGVGARVKVTAIFQNTGAKDWHNSTYADTKYRNFITLDTNAPFQRKSPFFDQQTWTDHAYRASKLQEETVQPGQQGTFVFYLKAPDKPKTYTENFVLYSEFNTEIIGSEVQKSINVTTAYHAQLIFMNLPKAVRAGTMWPVTIIYKNTGSASWVNSGAKFIAMNVNKPIGSSSPFRSSRWISWYRPAKLSEQRVAPGGLGHVIVWMKAPATPGTYHINFALVAENFSWMPDSQISSAIRVD